MIPDCLIVGGGVVGLSLAYELSRRGFTVEVIDRGEMGREASWGRRRDLAARESSDGRPSA